MFYASWSVGAQTISHRHPYRAHIDMFIPVFTLYLFQRRHICRVQLHDSMLQPFRKINYDSSISMRNGIKYVQQNLQKGSCVKKGLNRAALNVDSLKWRYAYLTGRTSGLYVRRCAVCQPHCALYVAGSLWSKPSSSPFVTVAHWRLGCLQAVNQCVLC